MTTVTLRVFSPRLLILRERGAAEMGNLGRLFLFCASQDVLVKSLGGRAENAHLVARFDILALFGLQCSLLGQ